MSTGVKNPTNRSRASLVAALINAPFGRPVSAAVQESV
jgi:hypothetical protein